MQPSNGSSAGAPMRVRHEPLVVPPRVVAVELKADFLTVSCQECGAPVEVTEAIRAQVEQQVLDRVGREQRARDSALREAHARDLTAAREKAEAEARSAVAIEVDDLRAAAIEQKAAIDSASVKELELLRRLRALEEKQGAFDLEVARRVDEQSAAIRSAVGHQLCEEHRLQMIQKEEQLASLSRTIEDLKRKADQGSQQLQGEAAEADLQRALGTACPLDNLTPIAQGARGGDLKHVVRNPEGSQVGVILWDVKNTKNWSEGWIDKIREDQQRERADIAVLVTAAMPPSVKSFGLVKGVFVCAPAHAMALCAILRAQLVQLHEMRLASEGVAGKKELIYRYLSSAEFRQRVVAVLATYGAMREDLTKERTFMERQWAKREKQLEKAASNGAGMIGDIQGIIGKSAPEIEALSDDGAEQPRLPAAEAEPELDG